MRVGIIQSAYIPWRGYFDFIDNVDVFVTLDDIQYPQGRSWRSRNQVKTSEGLRWLTVPVQSGAHHLKIYEVRIGEMSKPWQDEHQRLLGMSLGEAPYYSEALGLWREAVGQNDKFLSQLNLRLIESISKYFGIKTRMVQSRELNVNGTKTQRLINLLTELGATCYVSGPVARGYLDEDMFRENGIRLEYKSYDYEPYPQLWGPFEGAVSVLDLIANCGHLSKELIHSTTPNNVVIP